MKLADRIKLDLLRALQNERDILIPNYYLGDYEMDVLRVTKSDILYEYEIKVSKSDFKADFNKSSTRTVFLDDYFNLMKNKQEYKTIVTTHKHTEILEGKRANKFFFVMPENLVPLEVIPKHLGVIYYKDGNFTIVRSAKMLHKKKVNEDPTFYKDMANKLSWRCRAIESKLKLKNDRRTI